MDAAATTPPPTSSEGHHAEEHHSHVGLYLKVFFALLILTVLEYLYAKVLAEATFLLLVFGLVMIAVIKAALVGMYFMHLSFEGRWKYVVLIPTAFLVAVLVLALIPDVAMEFEEPDPNLEEQLIELRLPASRLEPPQSAA